jgi:SAM-dependent methyltransferase
MSKDLLNTISDYYSKRILEHGATPKGVDWNGEESQNIRFNQLMKVVENETETFSLLDYGCGYGGMLEYLHPAYGSRMNYVGLDISTEMIKAAKEKHANNANFYLELPDNFKVDYLVASGLFNVRQEISDKDWFEYIIKTLNEFNQLSLKGFSFNILTSYSDESHKRDYLYYAKPEDLFAYCKTHFSKQVALLHDYPLYEFTILVKKEIQ